jgi:amino acid transporter
MYEGDIQEWDVVGNLVGVKVPPPIPEVVFSIVPVVMVVLALLNLVAAFKPALLKIATIAPWVVLAGLMIFTQYSLYIFGHDLAPDRPLRYVEPFTPPVIGVKKIGSLVTWHLPHVGSFVFIGAALLLYWAFRINRKKGSIDVEKLSTT